MQLNSGQQIAVDGVLLDIENGEKGAAIVGEGGTGKTFSTAELLRISLAQNKRVLMAAPTNKAVKQLEKAARAAGLDMNRITFSTIHSALGLALMPSSERKHVARTGESILPMFDIVVLDEGSMVNTIMLENYLLPDLEEALRKTGKKVFVLAMGDLMQLPPVKEKESKIFSLFKTYELTENQRQLTNEDGSENGILKLCRSLRQAIEKAGPFYFNKAPASTNPKATVFLDIPENNLTMVQDKDFMVEILSRFDLTTDLEQIRVIAWRNTRLDYINQRIRNKLYGTKAAMFEVDEQVVLGAPIKDDQKMTVLGTDEECKVAAVSESSVWDERSERDWKTICLCLHPIYADVAQVFAHIIHPDEREDYERRRNQLADDAKKDAGPGRFRKWSLFHEFNDLFNDIRYCYAITAHRAQGSTYDTVIVDVKDMMDNPRREEAQRLVYVGFSRARHELIFNKLQFIV